MIKILIAFLLGYLFRSYLAFRKEDYGPSDG